MSLPIYLIGARGCGKTTVGQVLARTLDYSFSDTDYHLQQSVQRSVAEIVASEGWESFRAQETQALHAVTAPATVIATGGGMVLAEVNRRYMRDHGHVIWLSAPADALANRLQQQPKAAQRPTLTGQPIAEEMSEILRERAPLYQQCAHYQVDATQAPEQVALHIVHLLAQARAS